MSLSVLLSNSISSPFLAASNNVSLFIAMGNIVSLSVLQQAGNEPLYARVNKANKSVRSGGAPANNDMMTLEGGDGGADSWV